MMVSQFHAAYMFQSMNLHHLMKTREAVLNTAIHEVCSHDQKVQDTLLEVIDHLKHVEPSAQVATAAAPKGKGRASVGGNVLVSTSVTTEETVEHVEVHEAVAASQSSIVTTSRNDINGGARAAVRVSQSVETSAAASSSSSSSQLSRTSSVQAGSQLISPAPVAPTALLPSSTIATHQLTSTSVESIQTLSQSSNATVSHTAAAATTVRLTKGANRKRSRS